MLEIKYRTWYKGMAPNPIKLKIPGWAGDPNKHQNGDKPQPWHCLPFIEGSTYGLELCYPFDSECRVSMIDNEIKFDGDFSQETTNCPHVSFPPFLAFAPGHFGTTSALDIKVPEGYVLRTEPHPRFYTDTTNTVPCCIPGHLQAEWWPKFFFVVFKNPMPGQTIIFRKNEPYCQILIIPKKISYDIKEMNKTECDKRGLIDEKINKLKKYIAKNDWHDNKGHNFDDKYKILSSIFSKDGQEGLEKFLDSIESKLNKKKKVIGKLIIKK